MLKVVATKEHFKFYKLGLSAAIYYNYVCSLHKMHEVNAQKGGHICLSMCYVSHTINASYEICIGGLHQKFFGNFHFSLF
jgi:hypothetical protein